MLVNSNYFNDSESFLCKASERSKIEAIAIHLVLLFVQDGYSLMLLSKNFQNYLDKSILSLPSSVAFGLNLGVNLR